MKQLIFFCVGIGLCFFPLMSFSQTKLDFESFQAMVIKNHPLSLKIDLKTDLANWYLVKAKGAFDPKLVANTYQKYLDNQNQFSLLEGGVKIPTRTPVTLESGIDLNDGTYLNPQNKTGNTGLIYAGVSVNVLQGLLTDPARTELKKAELFQELTLAEQQLLMNDLLYYSGKSYWEWFTSFHIFMTYQEALELAQNRFEFIKESALLGDRPLYDTIESSIFRQNIYVLYNQARTEYENSVLNLSLFLWDENLQPLFLDSTIIPPSPDEISVDDSLILQINSLRTRLSEHPEIRINQNKAENLLLDRKLYLEQIKPDLKLKYNFLSESLSESPVLSFNNYTWGLHFYMPVFLRKERANLKVTDLKLRENELELAYKSNLIKTEFDISLNNWELTTSLLTQWKNIVANTKLLAEGETQLFEAGESSIFMVNTRQVNYLNSRLKYFEVISKNNETLLATFKAAGLLNSNL